MEKTDTNPQIKVYGYRWIVLTVFAIVTVMLSIQWLTFAPIAREARLAYDVSTTHVDMLSAVFMFVFILLAIPVSMVYEAFGTRIGIGIGAVIVGLFGLFKGFFADDYTMVLIAQGFLAIAQAFIIIPATKIANQWFPIQERALTVGIATLSQFVGFIIAMVVTPYLVEQDANGTYQLSGMLMTYGYISAAGAALLLILFKERPPTPPSAESQEERTNVLKGIAQLFKKRDIVLLVILFFFGLGMFNAIMTCIDQICEQKGLTTEQTGLVGGIMLIAGILGGVVLPFLSDKLRKRKAFILLAMVCMTPGLVGLALVEDYSLLLISSAVLGFFLLGAGAPVGFQYAAEVGHPVPESTSQALVLLVGQISGIGFVLGMNEIGIRQFMILFIGLGLASIVISLLLRESTMIRAAAQKGTDDSDD